MVAAAPKLFVKEVLRPGVYFKDGERFEFTSHDVRDFEQSLKRLHDETGFRVPVLREHVPQADGQREGVPYDPFEEEADKLRRTVGRSAIGDPRTRINAEGGLDVAFEVPDEETARQLSQGLIEFVSPELRAFWVDGKGRRFDKLITHVALTHRPIVTDQRRGFQQLSSAPVARLNVIQLSHYDYAGDLTVTTSLARSAAKPRPKLNSRDRAFIGSLLLQLSDDKEFPPKKKKDGDGDGEFNESDPPRTGEETEPNLRVTPASAEPANPDLPKDGKAAQIMEALLAHLTKRGIALPSDTDETNLAERLLTATMSLNSADDLRHTEEAEDDGNSSMMAQEINPMTTAQMSATANPRKALVDRIRNCKGLPAELRDTLLVRVGTTQFSASGAEKIPAGAIAIGELVEMYESQAVQFSDGSPAAKLAARIKSMRGKQLEPAVADQLLARVGSVQFSDAGKEVATSGLSISALLDSMEAAKSGVERLLANETAQLSGTGGTEGLEHPRGRAFTAGAVPGADASDPATVQLSAALLERTGHIPRKDNKLAINAVEVRRAPLAG